MATNDAFAPAIDLDHVGFIVPDLGRAHALFEALGFTVTPRADHTRTDALGRVVSAGSSQHSLMFDSGYVELMQITDRHAGHPLTAATDERYGLHVLALGTRDAAAWHRRCLRHDLEISPLMDWSRPVSTPERQGLARFRFFDAPWQARDPSYLCWVQHLSPELVRSPSLLQHANGACQLQGVGYAGRAAALTQWERRLRESGATGPEVPTRPCRRLGLGTAVIDLVEDAAADDVRPVSMTIGFRSPQLVCERARHVGLSVTPLDRGGASIDLGLELGLNLHAVPG